MRRLLLTPSKWSRKLPMSRDIVTNRGQAEVVTGILLILSAWTLAGMSCVCLGSHSCRPIVIDVREALEIEQMHAMEEKR